MKPCPMCGGVVAGRTHEPTGRQFFRCADCSGVFVVVDPTGIDPEYRTAPDCPLVLWEQQVSSLLDDIPKSPRSQRHANNAVTEFTLSAICLLGRYAADVAIQTQLPRLLAELADALKEIIREGEYL